MWDGHLARPGRTRCPPHKKIILPHFSLVSPVGCVTPSANAPLIFDYTP
ncbi:hypothetical protein FDUTEX481_09356 [Tolypothrix sp. PCC 7601]|nr:hypothetical protein FDUTEX481_09356 [Tolypothrix sp. PCC 7601]